MEPVLQKVVFQAPLPQRFPEPESEAVPEQEQILPEQEQLLSPIRKVIELVLGVDASSLEIVNRPPTRSKPQYMRIWEARKADGLDYDESDPEQQHFLASLGKTSNT